jgi:5-methyltetrahydrofolate--homocysteine methyltransferase
VHDIGKNLVDIILTNNGYTVYNLGIKQPISNVITAFKRARRRRDRAQRPARQVDASSCAMTWGAQRAAASMCPGDPRRGGLTRKYVEGELRESITAHVYYAKDAFEGLNLMRRSLSAGSR